MKNIHLLPTDKPSELYINMQGDLSKSNSSLLRLKSRNIYITDDSKIKKGDWCINPKNNKVMKVGHHGHHGYSSKKIILTTDIDLINDGVQAIDDEFLEWFMDNPDCEYVKIKSQHIDEFGNFIDDSFHSKTDSYLYKIIIPKEDLIPPTKTTEDIKLIGEEPTITITLNKEEARGLMSCIMCTHASGTDLDIGEMIEDKLVEFLNS